MYKAISVSDYHLRLFDRHGVARKRIDLLDCRDDDHARDVAAAYPHKGHVELWQVERLVETFEEIGMAGYRRRAVRRAETIDL